MCLKSGVIVQVLKLKVSQTKQKTKDKNIGKLVKRKDFLTDPPSQNTFYYISFLRFEYKTTNVLLKIKTLRFPGGSLYFYFLI